MQGAALRAAGIPLQYEAMDVPPSEISQTLETLVRERAAGNVTIPHKAAVYAACVRRTEVAEQAGAVNTFWVEPGGLCGDNTDVAGFDRAVESLGIPRAMQRVALLGAGGAASAVCVATRAWPRTSVFVVARRQEAGAQLAARFPHVTATSDPSEVLAQCTLLVNATPVGIHEDMTPCDLRLLRSDAAVMDLAYGPNGTALVRGARERGHRASDGREMLLWQGAFAFNRWFGIMPDIDVMRSALDGVT
jgi:shikimate dehydrogenase